MMSLAPGPITCIPSSRCAAVRHHFHKAVGIAEGPGAAQRLEGEAPHDNLAVLRTGIGFGEPHARNLGMGEGARRHHVIVVDR